MHSFYSDTMTLSIRQEQGIKKIAIVGGNAKAVVLSGGGSASLKPSFFTTPYDGILQSISELSKDVEFTYSEGAVGKRFHILITVDQR